MEASNEANMPDPFGIEEEFGEQEVYVPAKAEAPTAPTESEEDRINRLVNERLEKALLEREPVEQPTPPRRYDPVPEASNDRLATIMRSFNTDPIGAVKELWEMGAGRRTEELIEKADLADKIEAKLYGIEVGNNFVAKHLKLNEFGEPVEGDYFPCKENAAKMDRYLAANGLELSVENYERAFNDLNRLHALKGFPKGFLVTAEEAEDSWATALSGQGANYPESASGLSGEEQARIDAMNMPLDKLESLIRGYRR